MDITQIVAIVFGLVFLGIFAPMNKDLARNILAQMKKDRKVK